MYKTNDGPTPWTHVQNRQTQTHTHAICICICIFQFVYLYSRQPATLYTGYLLPAVYRLPRAPQPRGWPTPEEVGLLYINFDAPYQIQILPQMQIQTADHIQSWPIKVSSQKYK